MGELVVLTQSTSLARRTPPTGGTADIIFFTGVRYCRMDEAFPVPTERERRRPTRTKKPNSAIELNHHA